MPRTRLFFITLEDLTRISGQTSRYLGYLPYLSQSTDIVLVGRAGPIPAPFPSFFADRIELPLPAAAPVGRHVIHPAGPSRLAALRRALAHLPSTPADILYADSILLASMARHAPHNLLVTEVNGALSEEFRHKPALGGPLLYPLLRLWERRAYLHSDRLIAISSGVAHYIRTLAPAAAPRIAVIGNGIDPQRFNPNVDGSVIRRERNWGDAAVGIFVSAFRPWHGAHKLVEALPHVLKRRPGFKLALVGDGPERPRIGQMIEQLGLRANTDLPGPIPPAEVPNWIAAATLGLYYPDYRSKYGFLFDPIKIHEYMACGKPTVFIDQPFLGDAIKAAGAGMKTHPTAEAFAEGICLLLDEPEEMRAMGERAAAHAHAHHTWAAVARGIAETCGIEANWR